MALQVGTAAPRFKAKAYLPESDVFEDVSLQQLTETWVCLLFFPAAFSPLCPTELIAFNEKGAQFARRSCTLLACSTDSHHALRGWCRSDKQLSTLRYPLLSDNTKRLAMDFGVLLADQGVALRGTFIIDPQGVLRASTVYDKMIGRSVDETLRLLDALQTGAACPCDWKKGEPTL